jgi:hypothetical protein
VSITNIVFRAGRAFVAAKGKDPEVEGKALADWLRSGADIGENERELLAELVTGEMRLPKGRPPRKGPGHPEAQQIVTYYKGLLIEYGPGRSLAAKQDTASHFGLKVRTIETYDQEARELSDAVKRAKANLEK